MGLLREQIIRVQIWRPQATFKVQLQGPAKRRLQQYHGILSRNGGDIDSAKRQMVVPHKINARGEQLGLTDVDAVDMDHAEYIDTQLTAIDKDIAYLRDTVLAWIENEVEAGRMTQMPPIEFLISEAKPGDTITNPENNYDRWTAQQDGLEYKSPTVKIATPSKRKTTTTKASSSKGAFDSRPPPKIKLPSTKTKKAAPETPEATLSTSGIAKPETRQSVSPPPSPLAHEGKGKQGASPADDLPLYVPPAPITSNKRKRSPTSDFPLCVPPSPTATKPHASTTSPPAAKKQKPSPIDTTLANAKLPACIEQSFSSDSSSTLIESEHEQPESAYTEVESSPIRARGMVYAGGKRRRVLREDTEEEEA